MPATRIVVKGRVQGVGFRFYTERTARSMGVVGEVWNRADGGVEILAEHPDQRVLDAFAEAIEAGPGYVKDLQTETTPERGYCSFDVTATR
jgi:acylphosphatase